MKKIIVNKCITLKSVGFGDFDSMKIIDSEFCNSDKTKYGSITVNGNVISVEALINQIPYNYMDTFPQENSVCIEIEVSEKFKSVANELFSPFWTRPVFFDDCRKAGNKMQAVVIKLNNVCVCFLGLATENAFCTFGKGKSKNKLLLNVSTLCGGKNHIKCDAAVFAFDKNPYAAISKAYQTADENGYILGGLRSKKEYPDIFNYLGWCSWNCCYHDVTHKKMIEKAKEFKQKNIPVRWYVIDDGWSDTTYCKIDNEIYPEKLISFSENKNKFPYGIRRTAETLKNDYNALAVGIWHSFTGYWKGVSEKTEFFKNNRECFIKTPGDYYIASPDRSYEFYALLYKYLKNSLIDFVKVDTQGACVEYIKNMPDACEKINKIYEGYSRAISENYHNKTINCMSHNNMCQFFASESSVIRSSDDFYPNDIDSFSEHAVMNAYNSVFLSNMWYCDYDMWWTNHETAQSSGMMRAISGGPVYISDRIGESFYKYILPLADKDGKIYKCDNVGRVTEDLFFENPVEEQKILKMFNRCGSDGVVALFNMSDKKLKARVSCADFGGKGEFIAYLWGQKCFLEEEIIEIVLQPKSSEMVNFYHKVGNDIFVGDLTKYVSVADFDKKKISIEEIL